MPPLNKEQLAHDLRERLPIGSRVYTVLRHVTSTGMKRWISLFVIVNNEPIDLSYRVALLLDLPRNTRNHEGIEVGGGGMDMGFHLVYELAYRLYANQEFLCIGEGCPANDHSNGDRDYTPHLHSQGSAGYALRQSWL